MGNSSFGEAAEPREERVQTEPAKRQKIHSVVDFTFKSKGVGPLGESHFITPMAKKMEDVERKLNEIKQCQVDKQMRVIKKQPRSKITTQSWVKIGSQEETSRCGPNNPGNLSRFSSKPSESTVKGAERGLVELSEKMERKQTKEVNRVMKLFSLKSCDSKTIGDLKKYLALISSATRAEFEVSRFIKEKGFKVSEEN